VLGSLFLVRFGVRGVLTAMSAVALAKEDFDGGRSHAVGGGGGE